PRRNAILSALLVIANLVALNVLTDGIRARADLTEQREYTISDVSKSVLRGLDDRLEIYGYFSEQTHPKLAPLVPKIHDLLEEYRAHAGGKLVVTWIDPRADEEAEKEAYRRFDIRPRPFQLESQYERGVRSAYFNLVV